MESNKDESLKCLRLSNECLAKEQFDKALKFAHKSLKLFPSQEAKDLIENIKRRMSHSNNENQSDEADGLRQRRSTPNGSAQQESSGTVSADYTSEQLEAVKRIKRCKDYYEILGVEKNASDSDLKKSYRKLALQFHPDKNRAPGATEAFKAIGNAFSVLSDQEKRRKYDLYGEEEARTPRRNHHQYDYTHGGFEGDINPEDLFNMFFGGSAFSAYSRQSRQTYRFQTHTHRRENRQQSDNGLNLLFQLSPILMMAVLSLLGILLQGDDPYRFVASQKYSIPKETENLKVRFYVADTFTQNYKGPSLTKIEREIESIYINNLRNDCYKEQMQRENLRWKARYRNDGKAYEQAGRMVLKSCDRLQEIYG